jgi:adenosylcobyric acid synthase
MHGPALARNPELADLLLTRATGMALEPLEVPGVAELRAQRLSGVQLP